MLQSLERRSGLPIALDPVAGTLEWPGDRLTVGRVHPRSFAEMRDFIAEPDAAPSRDPIYTVYREMIHAGDAERIRSAGLRYDITVIPPGHFAARRHEFLKTAGHYHPLKPGSEITYPEVYEVLSGRAYLLLQRPNQTHAAVIEKIYAVEAGPGEKAVIPPDFGHVSINCFREPLVMANWIARTPEYDYQPYRTFRGGGYWLLEGQSDTIEFEANPNYSSVPELSKLRPREVPELGLLRTTPLYMLVHNLEKLRFLSAPEEFTKLLVLRHCYR
ncbi:MAG: glucose-6-phosphate isomerase family protein [Patescibacteria group bacterium]